MAEITREHLELAALAAGHAINQHAQAERDALIGRECASLWIDGVSTAWNPGCDDGDAARLCAKLRADTAWGADWVSVTRLPAADVVKRHDGTEPDKLRVWREAVVLCAAAVGAKMKGGA